MPLGPGWITSSESFSNGNCVQVRYRPDGMVDVRDSKMAPGPGCEGPSGLVVTYSRAAWEAFARGIQDYPG